MPLKHTTETALVAVLGVAMLLAGIVVAVLSLVASPWILWIIAFFISLAYPLVLYPHFRDRRADYEFRLLHFAPAFVLLLWLVLRILSSSVPFVGFLLSFLTFGWALPLVLIGFVLLAWFCLHVIRQWPQRVGTLIVLLLPFALLGVLSHQFQWNKQLAALIDTRTGSGSVSSGPIAANTSSSARASSGSAHSIPPHLPHAGGGIEFLAMIVPAGTSAAVHLRAMRRKRA